MSEIDRQSDESLMARMQGGDHQAFAALVKRHSGLFYAAAFRMCGHEQEAEDIVQDAFLKLWRKPELWKPEKGAKFTTWFYTVVTNTARDYLRKRRPEAAEEAIIQIADERPGADEILTQDERQDALEEAIQNLPERQKEALNLCFYEEMSNKDAADIMGVGLKALESLLMRAKTGLRDELIRRGMITQGEKRYG